jgi:hypothetical protein
MVGGQFARRRHGGQRGGVGGRRDFVLGGRAALSALAFISQARYGAWAATYAWALGPSHVPACTASKTEVSSSAVSV